MLKRISVALALVMVGFLVEAPVAAAWEPQEKAVFNVPKPWGTVAQQNAIINKVEAAVDHTKGGSTILIATYLFDKESSVTSLIQACRRGVSVRVILAGGIDNRQSRRLMAALNGDNVRQREDGTFTSPRTWRCGADFPVAERTADPLTGREIAESLDDPSAARPTWGGDMSYVKQCAKSCRGTGASMHGKFYAFSRTGTATDVAMVSSSNLNRGGAGRGWNDLYTFKGRPAHYQMYQRVHLEMTDENRVGFGQGPRYTVEDGRYISRFFPWTGAGRRQDPVLKDLNKVRCHGPMGRTRLHISQFWIDGDRGNYIVDKLLRLARDGCRVSIIYGAPSVQIAERLRDAARRNLIALYDSRWWFDNDPEVDVRTHAKYILVRGNYDGVGRSWQVMTGTANWNPGSLNRGDENTLNIRSAAAYRQYVDNWETIRRHSRKLPYNR